MRKWMGAPLAMAIIAVSAQAAFALDQVVFQLGWLPGGDKAPAFIGVRQGLFEKEGLEVKILPGRGSADTITKVATGNADFGEAGLDGFLAAESETPVAVKAVMPLFTMSPDALVTTTDGPIHTMADVAGKTVATSPYTSSNLPWPLVLQSVGVDPASVKLIKADPATLGGLLATGQVDAIIDWVTSAPITGAVLAQAGKTMRVIPWSSTGYGGYSQSILASDKILAEHPDIVRRFLKVMREGNLLMKKDPQMAAESVKALVPAADLAAARASVDAALTLTFNATTERDGLGIYNPQLVAKTWEWVAKSRKLPLDKIDPQKFVTSEFVAKP